jgi:uncharacterized protein DUF5329
VKRFLIMTLASLIGIALMPAPRAEPPTPEVQREIDFLLDAIGSSGCEFYRNGTWHDAKTAQAHVGDKYAYLLKRDRIRTTEDFIDEAATRSSLSGEPYKIRCGADREQPTDRWLHAELARFRKLNWQPGANSAAPNEPPQRVQRRSTGPS